jgi:hypothetical protein
MTVAAADRHPGGDVAALGDDHVTDAVVADVVHRDALTFGPFAHDLRLDRRRGVFGGRDVIVHRHDAALVVERIAEVLFDRDRALRRRDFVRDHEIHEDQRVAAGEFLDDVRVPNLVKQ